MKSKIKISYFNIANLLFTISFLLFVFYTLIWNYSTISEYGDFGKYMKLIYMIANLFLGIKILFDILISKGRFHLVKGILIIIIAVLIYYSSKEIDDSQLTHLVILILGFKNIDFRNLMVKTRTTMIYTSILITSLSLFGVIQNVQKYNGNYLGNSYGFSHPNMLASVFFTILTISMYLNYNQITFQRILMYSSVALVIYYLSSSKTFIMLWFMALVLLLIFKKNSRRHIYLLKKILPLTALIFSILSILAVYKYDQGSQIWMSLNNFFTGRITLAKNAVDTYGITWFGSKVSWITTEKAAIENVATNVIDNGYLRLLIIYGIIPFVLFIIGLTLLIKRKVKENSMDQVFCIILFLIYGFMEAALFNPQINVFLLLIGELVYINIRAYENYDTGQREMGLRIRQ